MTPIAGSARPSAFTPWLVFSVGALSFCYSYFQRVGPSAMVTDLMRDFAVGATAIGNLSAFYFYSYTTMQLPVGVLVDRFGARRLLTWGAILCAAGSLLFAMAESIALVYAARLIIGVGAGCAFVPALGLAGQWFPPRRFALLSGLIVTIGMLGGVLGQGPMAAAVVAFGWRPAMFAAAGAAIVLAGMAWLFVADVPPAQSPDRVTASAPRPLLEGLGRAFGNPQTWALSLAGFGLAAPLIAFGALWAVPYLSVAYGLSRPEAAAIASLVVFGWGIGAPIQGWLSDRIRRRKLPVAIANFGVLACFGCAIYVPDVPLRAVQGLCLLGGFFCGGMVSAYAGAREHNPDAQGTALAVVNTVTIAAGMILQPLIGLLLDLQWDGSADAGARVYSVAAFRNAFLSIAVGVAMGLIASLCVRETFGRPVR